MKHVHADLIMKYAEIAQQAPKPWKYFQVSYDSVEWDDLIAELQFSSKYYYRLKPRTININGFEVPEPLMLAPVRGTECYFIRTPYIERESYIGGDTDTKLLKAGLIHLTRENAEKHLEALLSFTKE